MAGWFLSLFVGLFKASSDLFHVLRPMRMSLLVLLLGGGVLIYADQSQDILRGMAHGGVFINDLPIESRCTGDPESCSKSQQLAKNCGDDELVIKSFYNEGQSGQVSTSGERNAGRADTGRVWPWILFYSSVLIWAFATWYGARIAGDLIADGGKIWPVYHPRWYKWGLNWWPRILGGLVFVSVFCALAKVDLHWGWYGGINAALGLAFMVFVWSRRRLLHFYRPAGATGSVTELRITLKGGLHPLAQGIAQGLLIILPFVLAVASYGGIGSYQSREESTPLLGVMVVVLIYLPAAIMSLWISGKAGLITCGFLVFAGGLHLAGVVDPVWTGRMVGSAPLFLLAIAGWVPLGTLLAIYAERRQAPVFLVLGLMLLGFSYVNDNHEVRRLKEGPTWRPSVAEAYRNWAAKWDGSPPIPIIVAAEGGGIRAAYWTAQVLNALGKADDTFHDRLFAISGVSGGALGAVTYRVLRDQERLCSGTIHKALAQDFLGPAFASMFYADLLQRFLPVAVMPDRAAAIERAWETAFEASDGKTPLKEPFLKLAVDEAATRKAKDKAKAAGTAEPAGIAAFPLLFLNGSAVNFGGRIVASTAELELPTGQYQDLWVEYGIHIRTSTAISNSARFPVVSPAGTIRRDKEPGITLQYRVEQVVDGGYYDNNGALTVADIVAELREKARVEKVAVIQILNDLERPQDGVHESIRDGLVELSGACASGAVKEGAQKVLEGIRAACGRLANPMQSYLVELGNNLKSARARCDERLQEDGGFQKNFEAMQEVCTLSQQSFTKSHGEFAAIVNGLLATRGSHAKQGDDGLRRQPWVSYAAVDMFGEPPAAWRCNGENGSAAASSGKTMAPPLGWVLSPPASANMLCQSHRQIWCAAVLLSKPEDVVRCYWNEVAEGYALKEANAK